MQYVIIAYDYKDVLEKRLTVREKHLELGDEMKNQGKMLYAVAMQDSDGKMNGSIIVMNVDSREEVDEYLKKEPYVASKVWEDIQIIPCKVGPSFVKS